MEDSILERIPTETRIKIYEEVFGGARIRVLIGDPYLNEPAVSYRFSRNCSLAFTCRAIRAESAEAMWRGAVVGARRTYASQIFLEDLNAVLPDEIARHITHLEDISLPSDSITWVNRGEKDLTDAAFLAKYPRLKRISNVTEFEDQLREQPVMVDGMSVEDYLRLVANDSFEPQIVPFEYEAGEKPDKYLERIYGFGAGCGVQIMPRDIIHSYGLEITAVGIPPIPAQAKRSKGLLTWRCSGRT